MLKMEHNIEVSLMMMEDAACSYREVEILLLPIIFNGHFHLFVFNKEKKEFQHYSSL